MNFNLLLLGLMCFFFVSLQAQENLSKYSYAELDSLMGIHYNKGAFVDAIPMMEAGMKKAKAEFGELDSIYAQYYNNLGFFYQQAGQTKKSIEIYQEVLALRKKIYPKAHPDLSVSLSNLGSSYYQTGQYEKATPLYLESITMIEALKGKDSWEYGQSLNNLATLYFRQGHYDKTEALFKEVLAVYKKTLGVNHPAYASTLNNLAGLYTQEGKRTEAEALYKQAIDIKKKVHGKNHPAYASALNNLATFYKSAKEAKKAETLLLEAHQIWMQSLGEFHPSTLKGLSNLAGTYLMMGKLDTAFAYAITSIAGNSEDFDTKMPAFYGASVAELKYPVQAFRGTKNPKDYLQLSQLNYRSYLELDMSLKMALSVAQAIYVKAKQQNSEKAAEKGQIVYNLSKAAMGINDQLRNEFTERVTNLRVLKDNHHFVQYGLDMALEIGTAEVIEEAFGFSELNKSVLLMDAVKGDKARSLGDLPDSLALQEVVLQQEKDALKKQHYQAKTEAEKVALASQENELNRKISSFLEGLKNKYPKYHALKYEKVSANVAEVQASLDEQSLLLEYFVEAEKIYLFAVSKKKVALYDLDVDRKALDSKVAKLRIALSNYELLIKDENKAFERYVEQGYWCYKELLAVALEDTAIQNLIIINDGALGHLPFEVFLTKHPGQSKVDYRTLDYLLKKYTINYNYSATLFVNALKNKKTASKNNHRMLACAAHYDEPTTSGQNQKKDDCLRSEELCTLRNLLVALPAVKEEVKSLSSSFDGRFLTDKACNEADFKQHAAEYGIIHLAMHGILNPTAPMLSSLAFTENGDPKEDNFLQAYEIAHLKLKAELVVLSACETGYGKFEQGEGVISLARSFMYAGVPSLVVSLWQVNDQSTAQIMKSFYEQLAKGLPKDAALRQAKLSYLESAAGLAGHPAFWSPFIQLGDNRPVQLARKSSTLLWYGLGGLLCVLIGGGLYFRKKE